MPTSYFVKGFSKLEFAIVLVILGILAAALFNRLLVIEHDTERLAVDLTIRHIHVGLKLAIGERIMRGRESEIAGLLTQSPLDFLGESEKVDIGETARWHYHTAQRELSYRPRQPAAFDDHTELRWVFTGHRDEIGRMVGLRLEPLALALK